METVLKARLQKTVMKRKEVTLEKNCKKAYEEMSSVVSTISVFVFWGAKAF